MALPRFPASVAAGAQKGMILGVRAGRAPHRFLGVWVVVVSGRIFVRSWNDRPLGWFRAFLSEREGAMQLMSGRTLRVRARRVRGERLLDAIDGAYAEKYHTAASMKYVRGFRLARRRTNTLEVLPLRS